MDERMLAQQIKEPLASKIVMPGSGYIVNTLISAEFDIHAGNVNDLGAKVTIPALAIVTDVYLLVTEAIVGASADIDIGDEDVISLYADGLSVVAVNVVLNCNITETNADMAGFYYATANTIQAKTIAKPETSGKVKLIVKYIQLT